MPDFINVTTKMFFDRDKVVAAMDRKTNRCLSSALAFGRTVMRRGMKRRKKISEPGGYPSAHAGQLKELIYFGYDAGTKSGVIGPTLFSGSKYTAQRNQTVPQLLNEGGLVTRTITVRGKRKTITQRYRPRPFVALTLPIAAKKLAENMEKFDLK